MATALKTSYEQFAARESEKELRRWGAFHKRQVFYSHVKCNLGELMDLGLHIPSGYATEPTFRQDVLHTQRVWALMPELWMQVIYMHYVYDTPQAQNALSLGVSRNQYREARQKGFNWYMKYRDTDFSELDHHR